MADAILASRFAGEKWTYGGTYGWTFRVGSYTSFANRSNGYQIFIIPTNISFNGISGAPIYWTSWGASPIPCKLENYNGFESSSSMEMSVQTLYNGYPTMAKLTVYLKGDGKWGYTLSSASLVRPKYEVPDGYTGMTMWSLTNPPEGASVDISGYISYFSSVA